MQASTAAIIGYGKLPVHGDFVRHNANGTAVRGLDEWLREGLYLAKTRLGRQFEAAYDSTPSYRFLFAPEESQSNIIGVLRPSRDRSRRTFPFLIAAESEISPSEPSKFAQITVSFASFLDQADQLSKTIVEGSVGHREVGDRLEQSGLATAAEGSANAYEGFLRGTTLGTWCQQHWGYFDDSRKYLLFRNLLDLLEPLKGIVPSGFTLGLKFPLGAESSPELSVAFWMQVCSRLLGISISTPVCFWTAGGPETTRGFLIVFFGLPPARALADLLPVESPGDYVCDLETMNDTSAAEAVLAIPSSIGALLESEHLSLRDFLSGLPVG